jgi:hypothetical protein
MNNSDCGITCIEAMRLFDSDSFKSRKLATHASALAEQATRGGSGR